jgi:hypothetical protein
MRESPRGLIPAQPLLHAAQTLVAKNVLGVRALNRL